LLSLHREVLHNGLKNRTEMTHRHTWTFALKLIPALLLLAASDLAAEPNLSFNFKANRGYLSVATSDIEKALSGAHPTTYLKGYTAEGYTPLWLEMEEFGDYMAYRVIKDFPSETHTYWLGILDSNQLGIIGRPKGTDPGARSYFKEIEHQIDDFNFALKVIWVNKTGMASEPSIGGKDDHWFLDNSNREDVRSVDQGTEAQALSRESTEWSSSQ
jgi:hypothetical protein